MSDNDGVRKIEYVLRMLLGDVQVCVAYSGKTTSSWT